MPLITQGCGRRLGPFPPDQHSPLLIEGDLLGIDELDFEVLQILIVEVEAPFERSIGYAPLALEQVEHLGQDVIKRHRLPSLLTRELTPSGAAATLSISTGTLPYSPIHLLLIPFPH
jgi:hypothetical protein